MIPNLQTLPLYDIAAIIRRNWTMVYFGAVPYLGAMASLTSVDENYGCDSGKSIVAYFLCNASTWKGSDIAREVKAELKRRIK